MITPHVNVLDPNGVALDHYVIMLQALTNRVRPSQTLTYPCKALTNPYNCASPLQILATPMPDNLTVPDPYLHILRTFVACLPIHKKLLRTLAKKLVIVKQLLL